MVGLLQVDFGDMTLTRSYFGQFEIRAIVYLGHVPFVGLAEKSKMQDFWPL